MRHDCVKHGLHVFPTEAERVIEEEADHADVIAGFERRLSDEALMDEIDAEREQAEREQALLVLVADQLTRARA